MDIVESTRYEGFQGITVTVRLPSSLLCVREPAQSAACSCRIGRSRARCIPCRPCTYRTADAWIPWRADILHKTNTAKDDDAFDIQRPLPFPAEAFVIDAEGHLIVSPHGVDLMAHFAAVEIQVAVLLAVPMVSGHTVGVIVIAQHGQHSAPLLFQYGCAFLLRKLLLFTHHFSEHM